MYKNQLQELAQRSCFNLPSYACVREGPDHAPRFKATVNFNGYKFESPAFFSTLRQAEHAAAEVALSTLAKKGPSRTLAAKVLDETGVYKNLLQETAHRAGLNLPAYTTMRSGPGHVPVFSSTVELAGMSFTGELSKTKKQAQKNAAMSTWFALKQMSLHGSSLSPLNSKTLEEQEQVVVARFLENLNPSSNLPQSNQSQERPRPSSTFKSSFPSTSTSVNSPSHNLSSCNLPPEMTLHHIWMQQQVVEHQRHLMALGVSIPPLPHHRPVSPWMHPVLHPSNHHFSVAPLYFGSQLVQEPIKAPSMVTIQEIHAEKSGDTSKFSPSEALVTRQNPNFVMDEKPKEGKDDVSSQNGNTACVSLEVREKGLSEHTSGWRTSSGVQHSGPKMNHGPTSSYATRSTPVGHRQMNFGPALPAPRMQSGQIPFSRRPVFGTMQGGGYHAPFMAPAVQIRSVVPVCSAAPPRNMKSSSQDRPTKDVMRNPETGDISGVSSNLKNLHI